MAKHEQAVIDAFNGYFEREATRCGRRVRSFALDGQDAIAGADYILTDQSRFTLIEFKYSQDELINEGKKPLRLQLCSALVNAPKMIALHDQCHFIAWAQREPGQLKVRCNIYRLEVCNQHVFGRKCGLTDEMPAEKHRMFAKAFTCDFFSPVGRQCSLSLHEFECYIAWLLREGSGSQKESFELLTDDRSSDECALVTFSSVRAAYDWMQSQRS
ncbi:MAG: hypothetical protein AABP62_29830 [Planctomycetota bacterium]